MIETQQFLKSKFLIVDDRPENILLIEQILLQEGFTSIKSTNDPRKTLELYREFQPDWFSWIYKCPIWTGFR